MGIRRKPEETPVTLAAKRSYLGRVYLDWAKYPVVETQEIESGYIVRFRDLRYYDPNSTRRDLLGASVELDRSLNVVREGFGSRGRGAEETLGSLECGGAGALARVQEVKLEAAGQSNPGSRSQRPRARSPAPHRPCLTARVMAGHNH